MRYDASREALYNPERMDPVSPALFAGKPDALCAELSRLAYYDFSDENRSRLEEALAALGLRLERTIAEVKLPFSTQVFVAMAGDGTAYASFRGTQSKGPWDLITDLMALPVPWLPGQCVHHGFREAYKIVSAELAAWIASTDHARLVLVGHSLGGALATLCAAEHPKAELNTIGAPAVGNAAFAAQFVGRKVQRFRNCCDLVPRVPPEWIVYRQLGQLAYIDRAGKRRESALSNREITDDMAAGARAYRHRAEKKASDVLIRSLADHAPINYISALLGMREPL